MKGLTVGSGQFSGSLHGPVAAHAWIAASAQARVPAWNSLHCRQHPANLGSVRSVPTSAQSLSAAQVASMGG
jgi:hypothetical protein